MNVSLTRKSAGLYTTNICGEQFNITTFEYAGGGWVIYSKSDPLGYSDPIPTLRECRLAIAEMMRYKATAKAWGGLIQIARYVFDRESLVYNAAWALINRHVDITNKLRVWDVIDELGRTNNTFYADPNFDYDGKDGDTLIKDVLDKTLELIGTVMFA